MPLSSYKIGNQDAKVVTDRQAILDPAYPYIYLPASEFMDFATYMTKVFPTPLLYKNPCEVKYGTCNIKEKCSVLKQKFKDEGKEFSISFNLKGTNGKDITITLPWEEMLLEP